MRTTREGKIKLNVQNFIKSLNCIDCSHPFSLSLQSGTEKEVRRHEVTQDKEGGKEKSLESEKKKVGQSVPDWMVQESETSSVEEDELPPWLTHDLNRNFSTEKLLRNLPIVGGRETEVESPPSPDPPSDAVEVSGTGLGVSDFTDEVDFADNVEG